VRNFLFIGGTFLLLGAVLMVAWRLVHRRGFFERRGFETVR
jgi:hypothetical protein